MKKSPAQQLLEKLVLQQEQQSNTSNAPLILFQYSSHVSLREAAATRSNKNKSNNNATASNSRSRVQQQQQHQAAKQQAEADLYRRAQLRTPAENARRSLWGGPLWVEYLTTQLLMIDKSSRATTKLIWISTTTRPQPAWLFAEQATSKNAITVVTFKPHQSPQSIFCLDDKDEEKEESNSAYIHPLVTLLTQIRDVQSSQAQSSPHCIPIVLESATPLVQLYGFVAVHHFIQQLMAIPHTLILLPVLSESLTAHQHQQLEDLAHTALWLSNHTGQVDLHVLRRGIREQDSTVREIWEFALQQSSSVSSNNNNSSISIVPFRLVVGESEGDNDDDEGDDAPGQVNLLEAMNPALNPDARPASQQQQQPSVDSDATGEITKRTNKITLKLENDDGDDKPQRSAATTVAPPSAPAANAPRIFMQDDDPEFEDYDEEDPDDDLDI